MFVVDTNVLVYTANTGCPEHRACREQLEQWRQQPSVWYLTWGILYGFLRIATHPRVLPQPWTLHQAWHFVEALLASPSLEILVATARHAKVVAEITGEVTGLEGNLVSDLHIAALMKEHGVRTIVTRDTDFHRFPFLDVQDPLQPK